MTGVRTGNTEIYSIDPYTGDTINLTKHRMSHQRYPYWSPDGAKVVFTSDRDGNTYNVFTMNADGSGVAQITRLRAPYLAYFPSWRLDATRILYGVAGPESLIASVACDGSDEFIVGEGRDPHPSPDGTRIAFTLWQDTGYAVFTMKSDGTDVRQLTEARNTIGAVTPTYSPDGRRIAYSDLVNGKLELFVLEEATGNIQRLTCLEQFATSPAWSPDGKLLSFRVTDEAFWTDPDRMSVAYGERLADKRPTWIVSADGGKPHVLEALHYQCGIDGSRAIWHPKGHSE
jgi:TolB protein